MHLKCGLFISHTPTEPLAVWIVKYFSITRKGATWDWLGAQKNYGTSAVVYQNAGYIQLYIK